MPVPIRFYIFTLGCKLNFAESSALVKTFAQSGWQQTRQAAEADWIVVHSCAVTAVAEKKTRQVLSKLMRANPDAGIAVTGCMADVNKQALESILQGHKNIIVNHSQKPTLVQLLSGRIASNDPINSFTGAYSLEQRTRSFLKIQDGCDYFCTYCTVPYARGRSISHSINGVLSDIDEIAAKGFREIILTGVNIATFGQNNNESFFALLKAINLHCSDLRIRMGSTEPELMSHDIIKLVAGSNVLMPHFHLPLQSGCDTTLQRMHRRYDTALFRNRVETIKQLMPHACVAIDIITGFPGETNEEFEQTYSFIESLDVSYLHVFPYSDRPLAKASKFPDHIHPHEIRNRVNRLLGLGQQKQKLFFEKNLGTVRPMLAEGLCKKGFRFGFTDNYIRCAVDEKQINENSISLFQLNVIDESGEFVLAKIQ